MTDNKLNKLNKLKNKNVIDLYRNPIFEDDDYD